MRVDEHTIAVGTTTPVFYLAAPIEGVPVLYLHGVPTSADDWRDALERTGGIAVDLPGFGHSSKAGNLDYSLDGYAGFIEELLERLEIESLHLVAHQWGAAFALRFAQRNPGRAERLVLFNPVVGADESGWPRLARIWRRPGLGELVMGFTSKRVLARALRRGAADANAWPNPRIDEVWSHFDQGTQRAILRLHRAPAAGELAAVGAPTLVLWGARDPWLAPVDLPGATVESVADGGHWPWLERPSSLDRIGAFLS